MGQGLIPSVLLYLMAFHPGELLASCSIALYKYVSFSLLELNHCPVYSENNEVSVIVFIYIVK